MGAKGSTGNNKRAAAKSVGAKGKKARTKKTKEVENAEVMRACALHYRRLQALLCEGNFRGQYSRDVQEALDFVIANAEEIEEQLGPNLLNCADAEAEECAKPTPDEDEV